jgi:DNA-binding response OmpR family regulator
VVDQQDFRKRLGADEYLLKPLDPALLRQAVRRLMAQSNAGSAGRDVRSEPGATDNHRPA